MMSERPLSGAIDPMTGIGAGPRVKSAFDVKEALGSAFSDRRRSGRRAALTQLQPAVPQASLRRRLLE
jgi:hypothetical protein